MRTWGTEDGATAVDDMGGAGVPCASALGFEWAFDWVATRLADHFLDASGFVRGGGDRVS